MAARAALHMWEEPVISGKNGSGAVFFSGCPLRCVFCQNHNIAIGKSGKEISMERLVEIFFELEEKLSRISEKQNETAREITQQAQDDKMAQKSSENPEKEAPEKLIDAVLTEVFS